ncbi:MAG TPA: hypothetical protein VGR57_08780 [Ktedonobacterales bacterium]|nr:hypothetical protein [Ktedonobacterales bacterium]
MDQGIERGHARVIGAAPAPVSVGVPAARAFTGLDGAMLGSLALSVALDLIWARLGAGWVTAALTDTLVGAYMGALCLRAAWRPVLARLALFGLVAGVLELATDVAGERVVHSLMYPAGEPLLWGSPVYMPLSWMLVMMQVGYLAWRLRALVGSGAAVALAALWTGLNIPFYEEMAYHAGWWRYAAAPGLGHTPYYVMLFEALIGASLPLLLAGLAHWRWRDTIWRGMVAGAWLPAAALASWLLIGR